VWNENGGFGSVTIHLDFKSLYPFASIRGRRIVRDTERYVGEVSLDAVTAQELGTSNIGVFVGGCREIRYLIDVVRQLSVSGHPGQFIVVVSENVLTDRFYRELSQIQAPKRRPNVWTTGCVTLTTPESLKAVDTEHLGGKAVAGVLLVDPSCIVYRAHGGYGSRFQFNDRPQHIARFRARHAVDGWQPPFFLLTERPAISTNSAQMLGPYYLEAWWFVDGITLRMGLPPNIQPPENSEESHKEGLDSSESKVS
jgi:hypothetical protein